MVNLTSFTSLNVLFVDHDQNLKVYVFKKKNTLTKLTHKAAKENKTPTEDKDGNTLHWPGLLGLWKRAASPSTSLKYEAGPTHLIRNT